MGSLKLRLIEMVLFFFDNDTFGNTGVVAKAMDLKTTLFKTSKPVRCIIQMQGIIKDTDSRGW